MAGITNTRVAMFTIFLTVCLSRAQYNNSEKKCDHTFGKLSKL